MRDHTFFVIRIHPDIDCRRRPVELLLNCRISQSCMKCRKKANDTKQLATVIVGNLLQFSPPTGCLFPCSGAVENKGARARSFVPRLHIRTIAHHMQRAVQQGIYNQPSVAIASKTIPQCQVETSTKCFEHSSGGRNVVLIATQQKEA